MHNGKILHQISLNIRNNSTRRSFSTEASIRDKASKGFEPSFKSSSPLSKQSKTTAAGAHSSTTSTSAIASTWKRINPFNKLLRKWNSLPYKLRLWLGGSTFLLALGGDYISEKIYENAQFKAEAEKLADLELEKQQQK